MCFSTDAVTSSSPAKLWRTLSCLSHRWPASLSLPLYHATSPLKKSSRCLLFFCAAARLSHHGANNKTVVVFCKFVTHIAQLSSHAVFAIPSTISSFLKTLDESMTNTKQSVKVDITMSSSKNIKGYTAKRTK